MQTIYLDISSRGVISTIYAKQCETGRKFKAIISDGGVPYTIPSGSVLSVWYSSGSNEGNYSTIGQKSAFSIDGNSIVVELHPQMLLRDGDGNLCLTMNSADGTQISSWNIPYSVEFVPGIGSTSPDPFYTAFSEEIARAIRIIEAAQRTPASNILDNSDFSNPVNQRGLTTYSGTGYSIDRWRGTPCNVSVESGYISISRGSQSYGLLIQYCPAITSGKSYTLAAKKTNGEIAVLTFGASEDMGIKTKVFDDATHGITARYASTTKMYYVGFSNLGDNPMNIEWIAIYDGEYTKETLPGYYKKGYAAELSECMRYFQRIGFSWKTLAAVAPRDSTSVRGGFVLPQKMRMKSPTVFVNLDGATLYSTEGAKDITEITMTATDVVVHIAASAVEVTAGMPYVFYGGAGSYVDVSADL